MLAMRGDIVEARGLLAPVCSGFTEGFEHPTSRSQGAARRAKWCCTASQLKELFNLRGLCDQQFKSGLRLGPATKVVFTRTHKHLHS